MNQHQIKTLRKIIKSRKSCAFEVKDWHHALIDSGIGKLEDNQWKVGITDFKKIEAYLGNNNLDLVNKTYTSRIEASLHNDDEKIAASYTTHLILCQFNHPVFIKNEKMPLKRMVSLTVDELNEIDINEVLIVENQEVFLRIFEYPQITDLLSSKSAIIYRGGLAFSNKGPLTFLNSNIKRIRRVAFFDTDPAGASLFGYSCIDEAIIPKPSLSELPVFLNKHGKFIEQKDWHNTLLKYSKGDSEYSLYCKEINQGHLAIMQEKLLSHNVEFKRCEFII